MKICVLSRLIRGQCNPHVFHLGQRRLPVVAILEQWTQAPYCYFRVRVEDGRRFLLRHDPASGEWQLAAAYGGGPGVSRPTADGLRI
jgi:hypothetical protein